MVTIELKQGHYYIVQGRFKHEPAHKIKVIELTKTSIYYQMVEHPEKMKQRKSLDRFADDWHLLEDLGRIDMAGTHG